MYVLPASVVVVPNRTNDDSSLVQSSTDTPSKKLKNLVFGLRPSALNPILTDLMNGIISTSITLSPTSSRITRLPVTTCTSLPDGLPNQEFLHAPRFCVVIVPPTLRVTVPPSTITSGAY